MNQEPPLDFSCPNPNKNPYFASKTTNRITDERKAMLSVEYRDSPVRIFENFDSSECRQYTTTNVDILCKHLDAEIELLCKLKKLLRVVPISIEAKTIYALLQEGENINKLIHANAKIMIEHSKIVEGDSP